MRRTKILRASRFSKGVALEAYSQWRFKPGSVPQVKMPIEFTNRPQPQTSKPIAREEEACTFC